MLDAAAAPLAAREESMATNATSPNANAPITPALAAQAIMASTTSITSTTSDPDNDADAPPECLELAQLLLALRNGQHGHRSAHAPTTTPAPPRPEQLPPLAVALPCDGLLPEPLFAVADRDCNDHGDDPETLQLHHEDEEEPPVLLPDFDAPTPAPPTTTTTHAPTTRKSRTLVSTTAKSHPPTTTTRDSASPSSSTSTTPTPPPPPPASLPASGDPRLVSYEEMIVAALTALPPPAPGTDIPPGHPPRAIFAWMAEHYALVDPKFRGSATQALKKGWRKGRFLRSNRRYSVNPHYTAPLARGRSKPSAEGGLLHSTSSSAVSTPPLHSTLDDRAVAAAGVHSAAAALVELMAAAHGSACVPPAASGEDAEMEDAVAPEVPVTVTPARTARKRPRSASSRSSGAAGAGGTPPTRARRQA
ncbi:hypothetical protein AMAG_17119 [Allomyces macrogynus ATCC 38327]|uniref:Histone H1 n=1 Tax=Allomyces macrogynus (strain ATCC 38327) TaxID=578462 RepID=A0A0L0TDN2_ALLM3|nr:hypothetical protein AMAG_17119 [Allomyces macrogynus ATCC 38327]|eukprot:KNE72791.1 hypothetical protein AMAG_17119 [Allomyces macrogynus ATCC 38327]